jgi:hypothetical protein
MVGDHLMSDIFKHHPWKVKDLVVGVEKGQIRLPDIQRPFVWSNAKVRDLFDSMYKGFPVGELMFWMNRDQDHLKAIGVGKKTLDASLQVVDGQQRLTSMFAAINGLEIWRENYERNRIRLAFNPFTERFEVPTPAITRSAEWIPDIREVFSSPISARKSYIQRLKANKVFEVTEELEERVEASLAKLYALNDYQFQVVQIDEAVTREVVADVFVRINSEGVSLQASDFILTWLSVFWESGRSEIEEFAKKSHFTPKGFSEITGEKTTWTAHNPFMSLTPGQLTRVIVGFGLKRGRMQDAYNYLRGRNPKTREIVAEDREKALLEFQVGQRHVLNPLHWDEFFKVLERAGFRTGAMITSQTTLLYTFAIWLIGRVEFKVPLDELREIVARWYFMSQISGRYTRSSETAFQEDLNRLSTLEYRSSQNFKSMLIEQIDISVPNDWWQITLPNEFETSSVKSPAWLGYVAALNILDAEVLLSHMKVNQWLVPGARPVKGIEKHHLFPKDYLRTQLRIKSTRRINQVANLALVEWSDNIEISAQPPEQYWPAEIVDKALGKEQIAKQLVWHALPENWTSLPYDDFLKQRRGLMAQVTQEAFKKLEDPAYKPAFTLVPMAETELAEASFKELFELGFIEPGVELFSADETAPRIAIVDDDGQILIDENTFGSVESASLFCRSDLADPWEYWNLTVGDSVMTLAEYRSVSAPSPVGGQDKPLERE